MTDVNVESAKKENQTLLFKLPLELIVEIINQVYPEPVFLASLRKVSHQFQAMVDTTTTDTNSYWGQFLKEEMYQAIKEGTSTYKTTKAAYIDGTAIDLHKISLATFLVHPRQAYCSYLDKELGRVGFIAENNTHSEVTITKFLKIELANELRKLVEKKPNITAAEGIEIAFQKIDSRERSYHRSSYHWMPQAIDMAADDISFWHQDTAELTVEERQIIERNLGFFTLFDSIQNQLLPTYEEAMNESTSESAQQNYLP